MRLLRVCVAVVLLCGCCAAQQSNPPAEHPLATQTWEIAPWFQGGTGLGHASDFKFLSSGVRIGRVLTDVIGDGRFRGTFEWAADIIPLDMVRQAEFYTSGPTKWIYGGGFNAVILKWNWVANRKVVPYLAAEGGVIFTKEDVPQPDTSFVNFTPGGAFGFSIPTGDRKHALDLSVHITHISNASLSHNPGINATMQFRVGYTWFR